MENTAKERTGYAIPPYRLDCMAKSVQKIVHELASPTPVTYSIDEARFILEQAKAFN